MLQLSEADLGACVALLRHGSKSFALASKLLPLRVRRPTAVLYAACRVLDDAVDQPVAGAVPLERRLAALEARVAGAFAGRPEQGPVDRALAAVVRAHGIPRALFDAMLEGFAWDLGGRRYRTVAEVEAYAARVAGTVGAMMTAVMLGPDLRCRGKAELAPIFARACDLGAAMQLSNIARDVGEDARAGRLYLPEDWLEEEGVDREAFLESPRFSPALGRVIARLLARADLLYERADAGVGELPGDCRWAIRAARRVYAAIGDAVRRAGFDSVSARARVSGARKLWLVLGAFTELRRVDRNTLALPVSAEAAFLVDAVVGGTG